MDHIQPKKSVENRLFEETSYKAIKSAQRKKWTLLGVLILIIIFCAAIITYEQIFSSHEKKIADAYAAIDLLYNQEISAFQSKAATEKDNLAKDAEPDHTQSMFSFAKFAKENAKEPYGWQAAIRATSYFISKNKNNDAQELLQIILPYTQKFPIIQIKARTALAGIYASENNNTKAIDEFTKIENIPNNPIPNQARLLKAQILFVSGNKQEAQKILNQIISSPEEMNNSTLATEGNQIQQQAKTWLNYIGF